MSTFSHRYGYNPQDSPILEDAPEWLRRRYKKGILDEWTYIDGDSRYTNPERRPLGVKDLIEDIAILLEQKTDDSFFDSWYCNDVLESLIVTCEWYQFYDIVELVGRKIGKIVVASLDIIYDYEQYNFAVYRLKLNQLFQESDVGWHLDIHGKLQRSRPKQLMDRIQAGEQELQDFEAAAEHYRKADRFLSVMPLDPENSIKEIVSAIESIGRTLYPSAQTLGEVIKKLRNESEVSPQLLTVMEKFYAYASSEPAVRHGSPNASRVSINDAELCLHIGIAIIRYLRTLKPDDLTPNQEN